MTQMQDTPADANPDMIVTPELVAKTISRISLIGEARNALQKAGYTATIFANRITVAGVIEAQLVAAKNAMWWNVYAADGSPPVWMVGAQQDDDSSNWIGCVE